jgi:hypothetical protein
MSKKYVPTFLKEQAVHGGGTDKKSGNQFAALDDDAPTMKPATLAALTSAKKDSDSGGGTKKSYASKFAEKVKEVEHPGSEKTLPTRINVDSVEDFPSLGGGAKAVAASVPNAKFADFARNWAKKDSEEAEAARRKALKEARRREEVEQLRKLMPAAALRTLASRSKYADDSDEEPPVEEEAFSEESDSYNEEQDGEEDIEGEEEFEENEEDYNQDVGYEGRRR